jgi:hypothetical protein
LCICIRRLLVVSFLKVSYRVRSVELFEHLECDPMIVMDLVCLECLKRKIRVMVEVEALEAVLDHLIVLLVDDLHRIHRIHRIHHQNYRMIVFEELELIKRKDLAM